MSFRFNWPEFDPTFYAEAKTRLETALNKEKKSKHIADHIFVKELNMGSKSPELEILEICELSTDYFRGIFKLTYRGDSSIALQTKIQANPLYNPPIYKPTYYSLPRHSRPDIVAAAQPLVIPMLLRISDVRLNGIIVLSVSKSKGITLVFKNDALESLLVSSTFDIVSSVKSFLQQQIESQLRTFLQDTLPLVVHEFSLRHINDQQQQDLLDKQQRQRTNQPIPFPTPTTSNSTLPSSKTSASLHQQQSYDNNSTHPYFDSFITNDNEGNNSDILSVPDLTSASSSSSASECFSDTSSENLSYVLHDDRGDDLLYNPIAHNMTPSDYEKYFNNDNNSMAATPLPYLTRSMKTNGSTSLYDNSNNTDQEQKQPYQSSLSLATMGFDDDATGLFEQKQQYDYTEPSLLSSTTRQLDPPPAIRFNEPITLSSTKQSPHGLLQRIQDLSTLSQTLAIVSNENNGGNGNSSLVHKTGIIMMNGQVSTSTRRKKIPKRRIIRWNS